VTEPITVVYKLYFSYNIGITNWRELNKPKYNDFWSQNIDIKQLVAEEGKYNGERFRYVVLRKTVLYPQKSGKLEIEPLSLDIDLQVPTNRRNIFGQVQVVNDNRRVSAGSKTISVKSLPEAGKPIDFSGAVGRFNFVAKPSKTQLKSGESLDLKVAVSGTGNLKLFTLPKPVVPNSIEMYDPVHNEQVQTPLSGMNGSITDTYTLIPQFKGKYPIKPLQFSYFDLGTGKYKTITSPEIVVDVLDGPSSSAATNEPIASAQSAKNTLSAADQFKYVKLKTSLQSTHRSDFLGSRLFYILLFLPAFLIPVIVFFKKKKAAIDGDIVGNRIKKSNQLAKKYLLEAKKQMPNKELFYIALEKSMHNFLKAKLHIETSEMSKETIAHLLESKTASADTITSFISLMKNCEFARYAPSSSVAIEQDFHKAEAVLAALEKQL
jgi:hypothetical protein